MSVLNTIPVVPGISFPFYPPRPITGSMITRSTVVGFVKSNVENWLIQPKLNGDRVLVLIKDSEVYFANRHGSFYKFAVANKAQLLTLPNLTVLDGEVKDKMFDPFEAVVEAGQSLARACPSLRAERAKFIAQTQLLRPYLFDPVTQAWMESTMASNSTARVPCWEGTVRKRLGSPYTPLASSTQTAGVWIKNKWL